MAGARPHWIVERLPLRPGRKKKGAKLAARKKKPRIRGTGICAAWGEVRRATMTALIRQHVYMRYFHISSVKHPNGTVLSPGRWGEALASTHCWPSGGNLQLDLNRFYAPWRIASEMVLETVRVLEFPDRPSRLQCVFLYDDENLARSALSGAMQGAQFLYEAKIVDSAAKIFRGDFDLLKAQSRFDPSVPFLPRNREIARTYWRGTVSGTPEIVAESAVTLHALAP